MDLVVGLIWCSIWMFEHCRKRTRNVTIGMCLDAEWSYSVVWLVIVMLWLSILEYLFNVYWRLRGSSGPVLLRGAELRQPLAATVNSVNLASWVSYACRSTGILRSFRSVLKIIDVKNHHAQTWGAMRSQWSLDVCGSYLWMDPFRDSKYGVTVKDGKSVEKCSQRHCFPCCCWCEQFCSARHNSMVSDAPSGSPTQCDLGVVHFWMLDEWRSVTWMVVNNKWSYGYWQ